MSTVATQDKPSVSSSVPEQAKSIVLGKFSGANAQFALNAYYTLLSFFCEKPLAHKIAVDFVGDFCRAMSKDSAIEAVVTKAKKDGDSKFTVPKFSTNNIKMTNSMGILRVLQVIDGLKKEKLLETRPEMDSLEFSPEIQDYIIDSKKWAGEQKWEEQKAGE